MAQLGFRFLALIALISAPFEATGVWQWRHGCSRFCVIPDTLALLLSPPLDRYAMAVILVALSVGFWRISNWYAEPDNVPRVEQRNMSKRRRRSKK